MSPASFALTKIQPPRARANLVARPALEQRLLAASAVKRLTLISAAAGFGKTAALTRLIQALPTTTALAWISADADDDLQRFLACLCAALEPFDPPWRADPDALIASVAKTRAERRAVAGELLNVLGACDVERGLIVLDDAHRVEDPNVFEFLDQLLERLPERWGLWVSTRVDPPLALARLRAQDDLAEFRQADLRFSDTEVEALVQATPGAADNPAARQWLARAQGWAAGLRLALSSSGRSTAAPSGNLRDRHVFDYLASEVLDDLAPELRAFLLRCCVLPELTVSRCAAVSGLAHAAQLLDEVERRGLFASVRSSGNGETALCLHDLFRDCLEDHLRREMPAEWPLLLRRAADTEPDLVRRVGYLARAQDWAEAEARLCESGPTMVAEGAVEPVLRMIEQFPAIWREGSPRLQYLRGLCAWAHWDLLTMCSALERAAQGHAQRGDAVAEQRARVLLVLGLTASAAVPQSIAQLETLRRQPLEPYAETCARQASTWHAFAASTTDRVAEPLAQMVDMLERSDDLVLWFQCVPLSAFVGMPGTGPALRSYIDGALHRTPDDPPSALRVLAQSLQAGLLLWSGQVDAALTALTQAEEDNRWLNRPPQLNAYINTYLALALAVRGERDAALNTAQARIAGLDDERTSGRREAWLGHFLFFKARVAAMLDDDGALREMIEHLAAHHNPTERTFFIRERQSLTARLAALDGRWDEAGLLYAKAMEDEAAQDVYGQAIELRLRWGQALVRAGRIDDAARALHPALARMQTSGESGAALFAGARVLGELAATAWAGQLPAVSLRSLQAIANLAWALRARPEPSTGAPAVAPPASVSATTLLTARERDVLARIAAGDSNKLIARAFDLSPHTIKRHVANILDKLALQSRGQAAAWHRAHS
jgi:LuxR family maltose regulon positive regulatory protein